MPAPWSMTATRPTTTSRQPFTPSAHLVRHLKNVGQTDAFKPWSQAMIAVLLDSKTASEAAADTGNSAVDRRSARAIRRRYHACLDKAFAVLPPGPPPRRRHQGGWTIYQRGAWNLAVRMRDDAGQVLRLLDDTAVPFDNNRAERALRMVDPRQDLRHLPQSHRRRSLCRHPLLPADRGQPRREPPRRTHQTLHRRPLDPTPQARRRVRRAENEYALTDAS